jgi:hypothetical protein
MTAGFQVLVQMAELDPADRRLDGGEAVVVAQLQVVVAALSLNGPFAVAAETGHPLGQGVIIGDHGAALASAADDLVLPEAEATHAADGAYHAPLVEGAVGLGRVLDENEAVAFGQRGQFVHGRGVAVEVNDDHRLGARRYRRLHRCGQQVEGVAVDVDDDGRRLWYITGCRGDERCPGTITCHRADIDRARARWMAVVPELVARAWRTPWYRAKSASNSATTPLVREVKRLERRTSAAAATSSSPRLGHIVGKGARRTGSPPSTAS